MLSITFSSINTKFGVDRSTLSPHIKGLSWDLNEDFASRSISKSGFIPTSIFLVIKMSSFISQDPFAHHIFNISAAKFKSTLKSKGVGNTEFIADKTVSDKRTKVFSKNLMDNKETFSDNVLEINVEIPLDIMSLSLLRSSQFATTGKRNI